MGDDLLQDRPAAFAVSTAFSISAWVDWGTLVTTWKHQSRISSVSIPLTMYLGGRLYHIISNAPGWSLILYRIKCTWLVAYIISY